MDNKDEIYSRLVSKYAAKELEVLSKPRKYNYDDIPVIGYRNDEDSGSGFRGPVFNIDEGDDRISGLREMCRPSIDVSFQESQSGADFRESLSDVLSRANDMMAFAIKGDIFPIFSFIGFDAGMADNMNTMFAKGNPRVNGDSFQYNGKYVVGNNKVHIESHNGRLIFTPTTLSLETGEDFKVDARPILEIINSRLFYSDLKKGVMLYADRREMEFISNNCGFHVNKGLIEYYSDGFGNKKYVDEDFFKECMANYPLLSFKFRYQNTGGFR